MMMFLLTTMVMAQRCAGAQTESPIIGIMAQPTGSTQQYIAASYVKFVEMAGGRAVPLSYFTSNATMETWLDQLNGVLFPGGGADLPGVAQYIVEYSMRKYEQGDIFPVWGTCLGFEWLAEACGGTLTSFAAENISLPLVYTAKARSSYLFANPIVREKMGHGPLAANFHTLGVPPREYLPGTPLGKIFDVLSTSVDANGDVFVSTVEGKNGVPIYGVQWHPEKNTFETGLSDDGTFYNHIPHSADASYVTFTFAASLINAARRSTHSFSSTSLEQQALFSPNCIPTSGKYPEFVQSYYFPRSWDGVSPPCLNTIDDISLFRPSDIH